MHTHPSVCPTFLCLPMMPPVWLMTTAVFQIVSPCAESLQRCAKARRPCNKCAPRGLGGVQLVWPWACTYKGKPYKRARPPAFNAAHTVGHSAPFQDRRHDDHAPLARQRLAEGHGRPALRALRELAPLLLARAERKRHVPARAAGAAASDYGCAEYLVQSTRGTAALLLLGGGKQRPHGTRTRTHHASCRHSTFTPAWPAASMIWPTLCRMACGAVRCRAEGGACCVRACVYARAPAWRPLPHLRLLRVGRRGGQHDAVLHQAHAHDPWQPQLLGGSAERERLQVEPQRRCIRCCALPQRQLLHRPALVVAVQHPLHVGQLVRGDVRLCAGSSTRGGAGSSARCCAAPAALQHRRRPQPARLLGVCLVRAQAPPAGRPAWRSRPACHPPLARCCCPLHAGAWAPCRLH